MLHTLKQLSLLLLFLTLGWKMDIHSQASFDWEYAADPNKQVALLESKPEEVFHGPLWEPDRGPEKPAVEQPDAPQPFYYQVNAGDTLEHISEQFGVSTASLMVENRIDDPYLLVAGQQLQIPADEAALQLPDGQPKMIKQVMNSTLTAYTAGEESTGKTKEHADYGITFSGIKAEEGRTIAVDPAVIPIGTEVFIDGVGIRTAEDTGSAVRGARIDVFMNDLGEALDFGVKRGVKVYILSADRRQ
jgi:3D (Asp-Asp-Asp) domain-containing protein